MIKEILWGRRVKVNKLMSSCCPCEIWCFVRSPIYKCNFFNDSFWLRYNMKGKCGIDHCPNLFSDVKYHYGLCIQLMWRTNNTRMHDIYMCSALPSWGQVCWWNNISTNWPYRRSCTHDDVSSWSSNVERCKT